MDVTEPHVPELNRDELELALRNIEGRTGRCTDINARAVDGEEITTSRHNIFADPPAPLKLVVVGSEPPDDSELDFAGTAYIESEKTVVMVYR